MSRSPAILEEVANALEGCLRADAAGDREAWRRSVCDLLETLSAALRSDVTSGTRRGRKQVHDRQLAKSALLDFVTTDPDGMPHQAELIRQLERRLESAGHAMPGETWLKSVVREFQADVRTFELDAAETYRSSPALQEIFANLQDFLAFRRSKARAKQLWAEKPELRAQFLSPEMLLEASLHKGFSAKQPQGISAHSRLPVSRRLESYRSSNRSSP